MSCPVRHGARHGTAPSLGPLSDWRRGPMESGGRPSGPGLSGGSQRRGSAGERMRAWRERVEAALGAATVRTRATARRIGQMPPPPGPFRPGFWRSPIRGPWLTSVFGLVLLIGIPLLFVTGLLSYAAYNPGLSPLNDETPDKGVLGFYLFSWPTHPYW